MINRTYKQHNILTQMYVSTLKLLASLLINVTLFMIKIIGNLLINFDPSTTFILMRLYHLLNNYLHIEYLIDERNKHHGRH